MSQTSAGARLITALLTHRWARPVKRSIRDARWRLTGAALNNPRLPDSVRSILFVCLGNICRSPLAAVATARQLAAAGRTDVRCDSAGTRANQSNQPPPFAVEAAAAMGLSIRGHRPQLLTQALMDAHDLIVVMEAEQRAELSARYPDVRDRVVLLPLYDVEAGPGYDRFHIADPFGQSRAVFDACYVRIERAVSGLVGALGRTN